jgi:hypothetical protein
LSALGRETNGIEFQQKLPLNLFLSLSFLSPPSTHLQVHARHLNLIKGGGGESRQVKGGGETRNGTKKEEEEEEEGKKKQLNDSGSREFSFRPKNKTRGPA